MGSLWLTWNSKGEAKRSADAAEASADQAKKAVAEAKRSADAAHAMNDRDAERRTEEVARDAYAAEAERYRENAAVIRIENERVPSTNPYMPFTYRLVLTNDGPQDADGVSVDRLSCKGDQVGDMPVTPKNDAERAIQGKLLVGYSHYIELNDVSGPNQTPDIAKLWLRWTDLNGEHREEWRVTKLGWDEAGDLKMKAISAAFSGAKRTPPTGSAASELQ